MFCPTHLFFFPFSSKKGVCNTEYSSGDFVGKLQVVVMLWEANGISRNKTRLYFRSASLKNVKDLLRIFMAALFSWIPLRSQHDWRIFRAGLELRSWRKGLRNRGDGSKWRWKEERKIERQETMQVMTGILRPGKTLTLHPPAQGQLVSSQEQTRSVHFSRDCRALLRS